MCKRAIPRNQLATAIIANVSSSMQINRSQLAFIGIARPLSIARQVTLCSRIFQLHPHELPKLQIVTAENKESPVKESSELRQKVRGESVGRLG